MGADQLGTLTDRHPRSTLHSAAKAPRFCHSACPAAAANSLPYAPLPPSTTARVYGAHSYSRMVRGSSPHFTTAFRPSKRGRGDPLKGPGSCGPHRASAKAESRPWRASIPIAETANACSIRSTRPLSRPRVKHRQPAPKRRDHAHCVPERPARTPQILLQRT